MGWQVLKAEASNATGGLAIQGINHDTAVEIDRNFSWNIGKWSVLDSRYDWSACEWSSGARERFEYLCTLARK